MLEPEDRVLTAVSGGPDSVALLHILIGLRYDVVVAHLDHMTRDGESARDAAFVEALATELGVPFVREQRAVEAEADASPESFEQAARTARYTFFAKAAADSRCTAIATGHTADDVAETVLWRMLRGTSVDGIAGIPPVRSMGASRIVRPLIDCTRGAVERFLDDRAIAYRHDPSNVDRRFLRNRIRHDLLPLLEREYNPKVRNALVRLATITRDDSTALRELLHKVLDGCTDDEGIHRESFAAESEALQRRVLQLVAQRYGVDLTFERTESARRFVLEGRTGAHLEWGGATLINTRTTTRFQHEYPVEAGGTMPVPGETVAFGRRFLAHALDKRPGTNWAEYCSPSRQVFDADILGDAIRIRARQPGDRFTPIGMTGTRKLQDYFVDTGTPQDERDRVPIVEAGGRIAWVVGGAVDAAFAVGNATRRVMELNVTDATE